VSGWIDLKTWKRRDHYRLFRRYERPCFSVTVDVDVTCAWKQCRKPGSASFFLTSVFLMLKAVNAVEAFRLRVRPRGVWRHDRVAVGPTIRLPDDTFGFARIEPTGSFDRFVAQGTAAINTAMRRGVREPARPPDDVVYHSVLPWFRFTAYNNALPGHDSIPRIVFGQVTREGRRMMMPVAVEVHHAVVDGLDVAKFYERFDQELQLRKRA
jgi:chloramphenicol O-acetyltransferase type A